MSDVLKNIADAVDNNSTRRGFSDLFADSKAVSYTHLSRSDYGADQYRPGLRAFLTGDRYCRTGQSIVPVRLHTGQRTVAVR